ncbi:hypothetical protein A2U01_0096923, partial [Trifolium medium]|nr:hypothetical protein [Trifolium medium]
PKPPQILCSACLSPPVAGRRSCEMCRQSSPAVASFGVSF